MKNDKINKKKKLTAPLWTHVGEADSATGWDGDDVEAEGQEEEEEEDDDDDDDDDDDESDDESEEEDEEDEEESEGEDLPSLFRVATPSRGGKPASCLLAWHNKHQNIQWVIC